MLIKALCDYYDVLEEQGKILDDAYSRVGISYIVSLTEEGKIDGIIDHRETIVTVKKDKSGKETVKEKKIPRTMILPRREDATSIYAYVIDHRPDYVFGLMCGESGELTWESPRDKAEKSHKLFTEKNAAVFKESKEPVCRAYYRFVTGWDSKKETGNEYLTRLCRESGKKLNTSGFAFCLSGRPDILLHESEEAKRLWEEFYERRTSEKISSMKSGFCSVYGREMLIPEIHDGIKAVKGMPPKVVCQNSDGEWSYGQKKAVGSSISYEAMKRYTKALSYLLSDPLHNTSIGDTIVIHWAASGNEMCDSIFEEESGVASDELDSAVHKAVQGAANGKTPIDTEAMIRSLEGETFYVVGIGLNKTRIIPRFVYRDSFGNIIKNVSVHQEDIHVRKTGRMVPLWAIEKELVSPKTTNEKKKKINSRLSEEILKAVICGTKYPVAMYRTALRRIQIDSDTENNSFIKINDTRLGILKGYINRTCRKTGENKNGS